MEKATGPRGWHRDICGVKVVARSPSLASSVYSATAATCSVAAGRLSFVLGLQGPCSSIDTACSSGLVASHGGLRALQMHECAAALALGVNMMFSQASAVATAMAGMTSSRGRSHSFDSRADGYGRGEGCHAAVLQPSGDGDTPGLSLLGSCVRQDGKSASLTAPNGQAQQALLRAALADGGVEPAALSAYEAHGTGTPLGDPIEVRSLAAAVLREGGGGRQRRGWRRCGRDGRWRRRRRGGDGGGGEGGGGDGGGEGGEAATGAAVRAEAKAAVKVAEARAEAATAEGTV